MLRRLRCNDLNKWSRRSAITSNGWSLGLGKRPTAVAATTAQRPATRVSAPAPSPSGAQSSAQANIAMFRLQSLVEHLPMEHIALLSPCLIKECEQYANAIVGYPSFLAKHGENERSQHQFQRETTSTASTQGFFSGFGDAALGSNVTTEAPVTIVDEGGASSSLGSSIGHSTTGHNDVAVETPDLLLLDLHMSHIERARRVLRHQYTLLTHTRKTKLVDAYGLKVSLSNWQNEIVERGGQLLHHCPSTQVPKYSGISADDQRRHAAHVNARVQNALAEMDARHRADYLELVANRKLHALSESIMKLIFTMLEDTFGLSEANSSVPMLRNFYSAETRHYLWRRLEAKRYSAAGRASLQELIFRTQAAMLIGDAYRDQPDPEDKGYQEMVAKHNRPGTGNNKDRRKAGTQYLKNRKDALGRAYEVVVYAVGVLTTDGVLRQYPTGGESGTLLGQKSLVHVAVDALMWRGLGTLLPGPTVGADHPHGLMIRDEVKSALQRVVGAMLHEHSWPHANDVLAIDMRTSTVCWKWQAR